MKKLTFISMLCAVLLLVGAGCPKNADKPADNKQDKKEATTTEKKENKMNNGIKISKAEPKGNRMMLVEFEVTDEAKKDAEGYRLLLSNDNMPTWPTKGNWYQLGPSHMSKEWKGLPVGKRFLRACIVKKDACAMYSDPMEVEIK